MALLATREELADIMVDKVVVRFLVQCADDGVTPPLGTLTMAATQQTVQACKMEWMQRLGPYVRVKQATKKEGVDAVYACAAYVVAGNPNVQEMIADTLTADDSVKAVRCVGDIMWDVACRLHWRIWNSTPCEAYVAEDLTLRLSNLCVTGDLATDSVCLCVSGGKCVSCCLVQWREQP